MLKVDSFVYSQPLPISDSIFNDYLGDYSAGARQMTSNWIESGLRWRKVALTYLLRYDYDLRFSRDTAKLYGLIQNSKDLPMGENFDFSLEAHAFHAQGLRGEFQQDFFKKKIRIAMGISLLKANYLLDGHLQGRGQVVGAKDYDFSATVDYQYTEDILFDRPVRPARGSGFSLDFNVFWQLTAKTNAMLKIVDFPGRLVWKNLPYTRATASSDQKEFDDDGFVHVRPTLVGKEGHFKKYTQYLQTRGNLEISHTLNTIAILVNGAVQYDFFTYAIGYKHTLGHNSYTLKIWPGIDAFTFGFSLGKFQLNLTADAIKWQNLKTLGLQINYPM